MGAELGRVSGPLLTNNLLRNGVNLSFQNTDVSVPVLQLDVNTSRIGINSSSPTRDLLVGTSSKTTNLIVDTSSVFQNFTLLTNSISHASDLINIRPNQASNPTVVVPALKATNILINNNNISNVLTNTNIELSPVTGGQVITNGDVLVTGTVHATGNITWDGDITLGNADTDNITFNADVNSNIIPNVNNSFGVGSAGKRWSRLYTELVHSGNMIADSLTSANNLNPVRLVGNTRYVSVNGNDTLAGNHAHAPYRTIRAALAAALSGEEVVIFPGTYTEIFPLTVPQGVAVKGTGIRSVTVQPTMGTQTNDCFLLNGETNVEFLTVANHYYNLATNTGYAFRFANGMTVTTRSPYVYRVTVLTQDSGVLKAGRGAFLDGAQASSSSVQATMLFYSVTFITKNADGLVMTNGVRCEWLNSFTYFAYRGMYIYNGIAGFAGQATKFGGELRSINSANVYGTYGVVGDGASVLAYLIGHNFGYIGTGLDSNNDRSNVIQANEIVRSNSAKIYYNSDDQSGDFRVGDVFTINQDTGAVIIVAQAVNFTNGGSISLAGAGNTYIDARVVQTGNISIHNNNIDSVSGPVNFFAANGTTIWTTNVFVTGGVDVTGNFSVEGNITVGNEALDTVSIIPRLGQTIKPDLTNAFSLGSSSGAKWRNVYINGSFDVTNNFAAGSWDILTGYFQVPNIKIDGNTLSVTQTDTDLNLQANGTGGVNLDLIKFVDTTISNNYVGATTDFDKSIVFSPNGTGQLYIDKTNYLTLPIGSNSTRTMSNNGEVRFNSATTLFEGYQTSGLVSFKDLYDSDRNTYITAELTPGTNDNIIRFGVDGTVVSTVDSTKLYSNTIHAGNVRISGNTLDNLSSSTDVNIKPKRVGGSYTGVTLTRVVGAGAIFNITIEGGVYKTGVNVVISPGAGYDVGTIVILPGFYLSGINPDNNCYVRVVSINGTGGITNAEVFSGTPAGTDGLYENNTQVGVMSGSGATFDITWAVDATAYTMTLNSAGTGYRTGERYKILGTQLGGTTPQNDIIFVVNTSATAISTVASVQQGIPFSPSTGDVNVNGTKLRDMTINMPSTGALILNTLEDGYVKFASNGLVVPKGTTAQRRSLPESGELRYNTELSYAEIYNGTFWQPVKGSQPELGPEDLLEIVEGWTLILG